MSKKFNIIFFLCLLVALPVACSAKENKNGQASCRPFVQSLLMRPNAFSLYAVDQGKMQAVFSGNWNTTHFSLKKSDDLAIGQELSISSAILSHKVCIGSITAKEFEGITNKLLKNNRIFSKSIELLKFEGLSEIAIHNKNWPLLQTHIKNFKNKTESWAKPLNFGEAGPNSSLYYLNNSNEAYHFKLTGLENYYAGILALENGNPNEAVTSMIKFLQFSTNYAFSPHADYINMSHNNNDLLRSALVTNSVLTMDFAYRFLNSDQKFTLTPEQQLDFYIISIRNLKLHTKSAIPAEQLLSPYQLDIKLQNFQTSDAESIDGKQLSLLAFELSQYNFRLWWPYDYGPYLWKYVSHLNINYWRRFSEVATNKKELRKSKKGLCSAELLHVSLGLSPKAKCS